MIRISQSRGWAADINIGERFCEFDIKTAGSGQQVLNNKHADKKTLARFKISF
jgi:hypothetical protein